MDYKIQLRIRMQEDDEYRYLNEKLAGIFEKLAYDCPIVKRSTIFDMMKDNLR